MTKLPEEIEISPVSKPIEAVVRPPGSKSITNRALICAALADGTSVLSGALDSEDTQVMIAGLRSLGIAIEVEDQGKCLTVQGCGGKIPATEAEIHVGNSGTTIRFLTALATLGAGRFHLDGIPRMRERPIKDLADALGQLGAQVACETLGECPPVAIDAIGLAGGEAAIRGDISSQYLSGLLMAAPYASEQVAVRVEGSLVSIPYVEMTLAVMQEFGVSVTHDDKYAHIVIPNGGGYEACEYAIEPDASAASYFWGAAAITGGKVTVVDLDRTSLQGDVQFVDCLEQMGCKVVPENGQITVTGGELKGIDIDMNGISDTVQTLAVVALFANGTTRIRNVAHIRHKETDRIAAVAIELRKLGAEVTEYDDGLKIVPQHTQAAAIDTYNDHRMAMSFALAGLRIPGVVIKDPVCTVKTYPNFFNDMLSLR